MHNLRLDENIRVSATCPAERSQCGMAGKRRYGLDRKPGRRSQSRIKNPRPIRSEVSLSAQSQACQTAAIPRPAEMHRNYSAHPLKSLHKTAIARWAFTHPSLTVNSERHLLNKIAFLQSLDKRNLGGCYASNRNLAKRCKLSERTVQRHTKQMQIEGIITIEPQWTGGAPGKGRQATNLIKVVGFPYDYFPE